MGLGPAEYARGPQLAISADRIFDGYRWHNDAVILIDGGVVQCIAPRDQSADNWPTEVMPPRTVLARGSSTRKATAAIAAAKLLDGTDGVLGLHLEGPFISRSRPGIHRGDCILSATRDDLDWLGELSAAGSSMVTLAPECVPAGFVKALAAGGIRVSVGHSEAN